MTNIKQMKDHLIEILYTGFRINYLIEELEEKGIKIDFKGLDHSNWDIAIDIIGFPQDNSAEILTEYYKNQEYTNDDQFVNHEEIFSRDWLMDDYFERLESLKKEQDIFFKDNLLKTKIRFNEKAIKNVLSKHIDWLKIEFEKYNARK